MRFSTVLVVLALAAGGCAPSADPPRAADATAVSVSPAVAPGFGVARARAATGHHVEPAVRDATGRVDGRLRADDHGGGAVGPARHR
jgi:hypothetical protein